MVSSANRMTPKKREKFLALLGEYGNVSKAAAEAKVSRTGIYNLRDSDPAFAAAFDAAVKLGIAALEDEAKRRAFEGYDKPVFYQGAQCGVAREYSDTLMIFLLKAHDPDKYAERTKSDVTLTGEISHRRATPEEAAEAIRKRIEGNRKKYEAQ